MPNRRRHTLSETDVRWLQRGIQAALVASLAYSIWHQEWGYAAGGIVFLVLALRPWQR